MRNFRTIGTALTVAMLMAATMMVSSQPVYAAPGGGNSKATLCRNIARAIEALTNVGGDPALIQSLADQYAALGCVAAE